MNTCENLKHMLMITTTKIARIPPCFPEGLKLYARVTLFPYIYFRYNITKVTKNNKKDKMQQQKCV
jgi:hypothetical protein